MISSRVLDWSWWSSTVSITWVESGMPSSWIGLERASSAAGLYCSGVPPRREPGQSRSLARLHHHAPHLGLPQLVRALSPAAPRGVSRPARDHRLAHVLYLDDRRRVGPGGGLAGRSAQSADRRDRGPGGHRGGPSP